MGNENEITLNFDTGQERKSTKKEVCHGCWLLVPETDLEFGECGECRAEERSLG